MDRELSPFVGLLAREREPHGALALFLPGAGALMQEQTTSLGVSAMDIAVPSWTQGKGGVNDPDL